MAGPSKPRTVDNNMNIACKMISVELILEQKGWVSAEKLTIGERIWEPASPQH